MTFHRLRGYPTPPFITLIRLGWTFAIASLMLSLTGCGGSDSPPPAATAAPTPSETVVELPTCTQMAGRTLASGDIVLPTRGASVSTTVAVSATAAVPAHCLLTGTIKPVDTSAPDIQFRIAMPVNWNEKVVMLGGGGLNGSIPNVAGNILNAAAATPSPLQKGYAVFGSDSGHQSAGLANAAAFALNEEALNNYIGDALKKTRDASVALVSAFYGKKPAKSYFLGISNGGKEALQIAGRWGGDWNGVVALMPALNWTGLTASFVNNGKIFAAPGAWLNRDKRLPLRQAALAACDGLDGVTDGIISNVQQCNATFDPATALVAGVPLRCPGGADTGNTCLSDVQIAALKKVNEPFTNGRVSYPGWNVYTADLGVPGASPYAGAVSSYSVLGNAMPTFPVTSAMGLGLSIGEGWFRYAVARDPAANYLTSYDPTVAGAYTIRLGSLEARDAGENDLSEFRRNGGKLLLAHGTDDMLVSSRSTEVYFQGLQAKMGADRVDDFLRFYLVPGFNHSVGTTFNMTWDQLGAIETWVEQGIDPRANQVVTDAFGVPGRTRPLCIYPSWPKYKGSGDVNVAASFACATS